MDICCTQKDTKRNIFIHLRTVCFCQLVCCCSSWSPFSVVLGSLRALGHVLLWKFCSHFVLFFLPVLKCGINMSFISRNKRNTSYKRLFVFCPLQGVILLWAVMVWRQLCVCCSAGDACFPEVTLASSIWLQTCQQFLGPTQDCYLWYCAGKENGFFVLLGEEYWQLHLWGVSVYS